MDNQQSDERGEDDKEASNKRAQNDKTWKRMEKEEIGKKLSTRGNHSVNNTATERETCSLVRSCKLR